MKGALTAFEKFKIKIAGVAQAHTQTDCLIFHRWGRWYDEVDITIIDPEQDRVMIGFYVRQRRRCTRCNKLQMRKAIPK